jgi:hypothetical protein
MADPEQVVNDLLLRDPTVIGESLEGPVGRLSRADIEEQTWTPVPKLADHEDTASHLLVFHTDLSRTAQYLSREGDSRANAFVQARHEDGRVAAAVIMEAGISEVGYKPHDLELSLELDPTVNGVRLAVGRGGGTTSVIGGIRSSPEWLPRQEATGRASYNLRFLVLQSDPSGTTV